MESSAKQVFKNSEIAEAIVFPLSYNGILFTRALQKEGIPVIGLIKSKRECFYYTNSCRKVLCDDLYGPSTLEILKEIGSSAQTKPVLLPTADAAVDFMLEYYDTLDSLFLMNIPEEETARLHIDKQRLYAWGKNKYLFPGTMIIKTDEDLKAASDEFQFPVIIKPNYRDANWPPSLDKAYLCEEKNQMISAWSEYRKYSDSSLVSEFIPGGDDNIETCHVYYDRGRLLASYTDQKIRQYPPLTGTGAYISSCYNPEIARITKNFFDDMDHYSGIGGIEFKKDERSGEYKIIEPFVGRPSSHIYTGLGEGFNFPYLIYCHIAGRDLPNYVQSKKIVSQLDEEFELKAMGYYLRNRTMTLWGYLKTVFTTQLFVRFSFRDPLVGFVYTIQLFYRAVRKFLGLKKSSER